MRKHFILPCALVAVLVAGGVAVAASTGIVGADGTIKGCYRSVGGDLRLVDDSTPCRQNESPISWNQQGAKGETGPQGPAGATGPSGLAGFQVVMETTTSNTSVFTTAIAACPSGTRIIGGGFAVNGALGDGVNGPRVLTSRKFNGETWFVMVVAPDNYSPTRTYTVTADAYCVNA